MTISILIPVYNVEKYIGRCFKSLAEQNDLADVEIIFVDDCSPDRSVEQLLKEVTKFPQLVDQIKIIRHKKNKGLSGARNTGIDNATGDYLIFLDSDDTLSSNAISTIKEVISEKKPDVIVFGVNQVFPDGKTTNSMNNYVNNNKECFLYDILTRKCSVTVWGKVYSRKLFTRNGIRFIEGLNYGEDYVSLPRILYFADSIVDITNMVLYHYYKDNVCSYTNKPLDRVKVSNILYAINILDDFFTKHPIKSYPEISQILKVRNKVFLLEYCGRQLRKEIIAMYGELNDRKLDASVKHRIVWELARNKRINALNIYLDLSIKIKHLMHC